MLRWLWPSSKVLCEISGCGKVEKVEADKNEGTRFYGTCEPTPPKSDRREFLKPKKGRK